MKIRIWSVIGIFLFTAAMAFGMGSKSPSDELRAVDGLIGRIAPGHEDFFQAELIFSENGNDLFELESKGGKVIIRGNNVLAIAKGLNWYLKYYCHTAVSYYKADPIQLPETLPLVDGKIHKESICPDKFFLNYCTFGYTMPWWDFADWERLIDWMALNGINMPLAITGQEAIWQKVWEQYDMTDEQIRTYFTGPAHLPWHRMTNIDVWQGPLPQSYLDHQLTLQKQILKRERELGMKPILPAFAGHVPGILKESHPEADIKKLKAWAGFPEEYNTFFLDPKDPLFTEIQKDYLEEQTRQFGTDHIYGADPFNELIPPSWEPEYLAGVAATIYNSMAAVDPEAQWLQMAWLFYHKGKDWTKPRIEAMLRAVPQDKMILLDYYVEYKEIRKRTDAFFGQPYIWCYLGNFGGSTSIIGDLDELDTRMTSLFEDEKAGNLTGVGGTLEAFSPNMVFFDYLFEKPWAPGAVDMEAWLADFAQSRCGQSDENLSNAWNLLFEKIYVHQSTSRASTHIATQPSLEKWGSKYANPTIHYDNKDLLNVWRLMLLAENKERDSYLQDLVMVASQAVANHVTPVRDAMVTAYRAGDVAAFEKKAAELLELIKDVDQIAATRDELLLGAWINDAKAFGKDEAERKYYAQNARNLLATWGPKNNILNDYANRHWAGLVGDYYYGRWALFISELRTSLKSGQGFDKKVFKSKVADYEWNWTLSNKTYANQPVGDSVEIAQALYKKYAPAIGTVE